jgi:hypothetical protein
VTYATWLVVVTTLYWLCRWYALATRTRPTWWARWL